MITLNELKVESKRIKKIIFNIDPIGKPRMVRSDIWSGRKSVSQYWAYKDLLKAEAYKKRYKIKDTLRIKFFIQMPESWSKKKKKMMENKPHDSKPDIDNLLKGFLDCLMENDSKVYKVETSKYWAAKGYIEIMI